MSHICQINSVSDINNFNNCNTFIGKTYKYGFLSHILNSWPLSIVLFSMYLSIFNIECPPIKS